MSENNGGDGSQDAQGGVDWKREINASETPLAELRQLVDQLGKLESQGMGFGEWVFAIRSEQGGVEMPRTEMSKGSTLMLSALSAALAADIAGRALLLWATIADPQAGKGA